ncbi:Mannose-6-phosphate isomerase [Actinosynnema sp. ALI-1.44]
MRALDTTIRNYHWGSRTALAALRGEPPSSSPEAELWVGAHPSAPSLLRGAGTPLDRYVAANPVGSLGREALAAFGPRLPFLLKVLAVETPLSLQVHPDREQARSGHAAGVFGDDRPKPEILVALTEFETLAGFRDPAETVALLGSLGAAFGPLRDLVAAGDLRGALRWALHEPVGLEDPPAWLGSVAAAHPGDPGVIAALLLNHVTLRPGQGVYVAAGVPHAHLRGTGVELMADSDNVVRAGLTSKPVDVGRVLELVELTPVLVLDGETDGPLRTYPTPEPEFRLHAVSPGAVLHDRGPQLLLCVKGCVELARGGDQLTLSAGEAAFLPHGHKTRVAGDGQAYWATTGAAAGWLTAGGR